MKNQAKGEHYPCPCHTKEDVRSKEATACALVSFADSRLLLQQLPAPVYRRAHALSEFAGARGQGGALSLTCGEITEQEKKIKNALPRLSAGVNVSHEVQNET